MLPPKKRGLILTIYAIVSRLGVVIGLTLLAKVGEHRDLFLL